MNLLFFGGGWVVIFSIYRYLHITYNWRVELQRIQRHMTLIVNRHYIARYRYFWFMPELGIWNLIPLMSYKWNNSDELGNSLRVWGGCNHIINVHACRDFVDTGQMALTCCTGGTTYYILNKKHAFLQKYGDAPLRLGDRPRRVTVFVNPATQKGYMLLLHAMIF